MATATLLAKPDTATPVKRGPGRPRKNPEATATATATVAKRRPGRPKGSKNKPKDAATTVTATTAPAVKRGPGRPKGSKNKPKDTATVTATAPATATVAKRRPGRPKGSKNKVTTATATAPVVKRGPGRPRKNATATAPVVKRSPGRPRKTATATAPKNKDVRQVLVNPFKAGESIMIPAGVTFTSTAPTLKGRQVVKRGHKVTVSDSVPVRVQPRNSEKGSNFLVRPPRIRAKGSGGYWKDITLTEAIVKLNGKPLNYENISFKTGA